MTAAADSIGPGPTGAIAAVRTATVADAKALAAVHACCFADAWSAAAIGSLLEAPGAVPLLLDVAGEVRGFILCRVAADECEVLTVAVIPDVRNRGFGRGLLESALAAAHACGARRAFLEVAETNAAARAVYARLGFAPVGRRRQYYREAGGDSVDALVMARDFSG